MEEHRLMNFPGQHIIAHRSTVKLRYAQAFCVLCEVLQLYLRLYTIHA